jgi:hypothetical protein
MVDFGRGIVMKAEDSFKVTEVGGKALPYAAVGSYRYIDGRFELVELCYQSRSDEPITGTNVRRIPVDRILREHLRSLWPKGIRDRRKLIRLSDVAAIYNRAFACHLAPTQAVADALGITHGAAEQRVIRARERGLLAPTRQGKAGA